MLTQWVCVKGLFAYVVYVTKTIGRETRKIRKIEGFLIIGTGDVEVF